MSKDQCMLLCVICIVTIVMLALHQQVSNIPSFSILPNA